MYKLLLHILLIPYILIYLFILGGGLLSPDYIKLIIYLINPIIFILISLPHNLLSDYQYNIASICQKKYIEYQNIPIEEIIKQNSYMYVFPEIRDNINKKYVNSGIGPLSCTGLILLSYIINILLLKFYWKIL
jgi:hypothetical protein